MTTKVSLLIVLCSILTSCGPNSVISDLPSPTGQYHVEVRKCPQNGAPFEWTEKTQVSVLKSGTTENCQSAINALVQFDQYGPDDQLQLEWLADDALRAWHPTFALNNGPATWTATPNTPIKIVFAPKQ